MNSGYNNYFGKEKRRVHIHLLGACAPFHYQKKTPFFGGGGNLQVIDTFYLFASSSCSYILHRISYIPGGCWGHFLVTLLCRFENCTDSGRIPSPSTCYYSLLPIFVIGWKGQPPVPSPGSYGPADYTFLYKSGKMTQPGVFH
jgi:hypothetical protein